MGIRAAIIDKDHHAGRVAFHDALDLPLGTHQGRFAVLAGGPYCHDRLTYLDQHALQRLVVLLGIRFLQWRVQFDCRRQQVAATEYLDIGHVLDIQEGLLRSAPALCR